MTKQSDRQYALALELAWFIRLRWIAGSAVALSGALDRFFLHWHAMSTQVLFLGMIVLFYNAALLWSLRDERQLKRRHLLRLAVAQILLDLICLALLTGWTSGLRSPILGFFVFHMVFASLLLPRKLAYGSALAAIGLLAGSLAWTGQIPSTHAEMLILVGFSLTLLMTVALTNHITRDLRRQRRRLARQNKRIRAMARRLWLSQRAMVRQEKIVALGQMAASVAHEVMNPLANMDGLLQLAQHKPERMNADAISKLREQIARINAIVQQMRSLVHPADGQQQRLPLNDVVAQSIEMVRIDSRAKRLGIQANLAPNVGAVLIRPQALQQVLVNLLLNSLDALAEVRQPTLVVKTSRSDRWYVIEVIDNGSGIKPEHLNRVFEPFFTTKPVGKGTGLGLSISYNLIQRLGGMIDVTSQLGIGTKLTIHLPVPETEPALTPAESGERP
ncbi:MAG: ATP-binding protein [Tepidisphaeraceae bacterium]